MNTVGDYRNLYLKIKIIYFSNPELSWDAMLEMTGIELELISDIDMHFLFKKGMRGGISYIAKRHSKANNK